MAMAETLTPNYGWTKPDPGASANTWGATLNATTDKIDAQVFANGQRGVEIGSGALWFTATPPANWLICDGSSLSTSAPYDKLFAVIGYTFGGSGANFNLPGLATKFGIGAGAGYALGATGGEASHTLTTAELAPHPHAITDVSHSHTAYQTAHSHGITTGSHAHGLTTNPHAHGSSLLRFVGTGGAFGIAGGGNSNVSAGNTDNAGNIGGNSDTAGNLGGNTDAQAPAVGVNASGTGLSTTQNAGGGAAHNNMPPWLAVNFIIKFQ
jgi:microcystin-dependent protein